MKKVLLGGGCYWCIEAIYKEIKGVLKVDPGFCGGEKQVTYKEVYQDDTGHKEVILIEYDEDIISYSELLDIFFISHDPTQINKQGNDIGIRYQSVIFYYDKYQKKQAEIKIKELQSYFENKISTLLEPAKDFYLWQDHKDYYKLNKESNSYCSTIINPKLNNVLNKIKHLRK